MTDEVGLCTFVFCALFPSLFLSVSFPCLTEIPQAFNIDVLVALLRQENAVDICVIKVPKSLKYTDYFVVVSGSSRRHLIAMAEYAVKVVRLLTYCCCCVVII